MSKSTVIKLVHPTREQNSIGEWTASEQLVEVFAELQSVSSSEWFNASQIGLAPDYRLTMFKGDYQGEEVIEYDGERYSVYRVYHNGDFVELYCQREAGTSAVEDEPTPEPTTEPTPEGEYNGEE